MMLILKRVLLVWFILYFGAISLTQAATDCNAVTEISPAECESLLQLYHSTNGANWHNNEGWNVTNTPCSWKGITCENDGVTKLYLNSNQLTGTIPNFSGLPNLQWLYLDSNQLTGTIPVSSNTLINLTILDLRNNPLCKKADYDYAIWPIKQSRSDDKTTWQAQLETFPICPPPTETGPIPTVLSFIGLKEYYQIGEIVDVEIAVNFTADNPADTVDLWIAIQQPSEDFLYMSALPLADLFSPKPQFFREDLGTTQETFSVISDFKLPKGVGGNYTFYAALVETGKNPLTDGAWVMRHIVQSSTLLSNR